MYCPDRDRLRTVTARTDSLCQTIVAYLDVAVFVENIARLKVPMDDPAIMQKRQTLRNFTYEEGGLLRAQSTR